MVFSSLSFIFVFLPIFFVFLFAFKSRRNLVLLIGSLIFYAYGEPVYILLMLFSILVDYSNGIMIERAKSLIVKRIFLVSSIAINLLLLGVFKYSGIIVSTINLLGFEFSVPNLALPIGISFYTFQTMSYSIDVYRGIVKAERNIIDFGAYVSMFPQLIAGPIVLYRDVVEKLKLQRVSLDQVANGLERFIIGLSKKVLLANNLALWNKSLSPDTVLSSHLFTLSYGLFILFDFSGYSDMAIGLGRMLGFDFPENFDFPYLSKSIGEFFRRWHMTLGKFFRDNVYFPLGGSRVSKVRLVFNLLIVWSLTGIWHGAEYSFLLWGLYLFALIAIEKLLGDRYDKLGWIRRIYFYLAISIGWILFSQVSMVDAISYIKGFFGIGVGIVGTEILGFRHNLSLLVISILSALPLGRAIGDRIKGRYKEIALLILFLLCIAYLVDDSYNPFIYFRF